MTQNCLASSKIIAPGLDNKPIIELSKFIGLNANPIIEAYEKVKNPLFPNDDKALAVDWLWAAELKSMLLTEFLIRCTGTIFEQKQNAENLNRANEQNLLSIKGTIDLVNQRGYADRAKNPTTGSWKLGSPS